MNSSRLSSLRTRYPVLDRALVRIKKNPQLSLAVALFGGGGLALLGNISALAGSLFGAGAALLGGWVTERNNRSAATEEKARRQVEARGYLTPELYRAIMRVLRIHERAIPNFTSASAEHEIKPDDLKEDFIPYAPVLYPNAPQFHDLSGDDAIALVEFYDSLYSLAELVKDWWAREGQLPVNIFLAILRQAEESLRFAKVCVEKFDLDQRYPATNPNLGTISSRIDRSIAASARALEQHLKRWEAKAGNIPSPRR